MLNGKGEIIPAADVPAVLTRVMREPAGEFVVIAGVLPSALEGTRDEDPAVVQACREDIRAIGDAVARFYGFKAPLVLQEAPDELIDPFIKDAKDTVNQVTQFNATYPPQHQKSIFASWATKNMVQRSRLFEPTPVK